MLAKNQSRIMRRSIRNEIRRLMKIHTGEKFRHVDRRAVINDLAGFSPAIEKPQFDKRQKLGWARNEFSKFDRAMRPKFKYDDQGELLPCDGLIPVNKNTRVWLSEASDDDLRAYYGIEAKQLADNTAGSEKQLRGLERLIRLKGQPENRHLATCGEVWSARNGWIAPAHDSEPEDDEQEDQADNDEDGDEDAA